VIALLAALVDICASPLPPELRDPADSTAYAGAGAEARASGDVRTAALAYRKAIALDPDNAAAKRALAELCGGEDGELAAAIAAYKAGDLDTAEAA
jgi:cytochrome c-type biogenesis protein CcmH/NrfG